MSRHRSTARLSAVLAVGLFAVVLFSGVAVADGPAEVDLDSLDGGNGDPYVITNASELQAINQSLDSDYELSRSINATNTSDWYAGDGFKPIGNASHPFTGSFDGNGYAIENLTVDRGDENYVGLFGNVSEGTKIGNVTLRNATVTGNAHVGALVGESNGEIYDVDVSGEVIATLDNDNFAAPNGDGGARTGGVVGMLNEFGTVINATASTNVTGTDDDARRIGGLVGYSFGEIRDSKASGDVEGINGIGGLIGRNSGHIENATATGTVTGVAGTSPDAIGGLAGYNSGIMTLSQAIGTVSGGGESIGGLIGSNTDRVNKSYATGSVDGGDSSSHVGGLVGKLGGTITASYATGNVSGDDNVGGLAGWNDDGTVSESYATGAVDGVSDTGGLVGYNRDDATVRDSYATGSANGTTNIGGLVGWNRNLNGPTRLSNGVTQLSTLRDKLTSVASSAPILVRMSRRATGTPMQTRSGPQPTARDCRPSR